MNDLGLTCDTHNAKLTYSSTPRRVGEGSKSDLMRNNYDENASIYTQIQSFLSNCRGMVT